VWISIRRQRSQDMTDLVQIPTCKLWIALMPESEEPSRAGESSNGPERSSHLLRANHDVASPSTQRQVHATGHLPSSSIEVVVDRALRSLRSKTYV
jgi:hypothetical protein